MAVSLTDLPYELLLQMAQNLSYSDLWYFGTCSKRTRILAFELILSKYQINLIRPKVINPFAHLVHAAVAYLDRHGHQPTTIQSVANHLVVAINDRTPYDRFMADTLEFLLDKCLAILIDSIFLELPFASSSTPSYKGTQLSPPPTLNENDQTNLQNYTTITNTHENTTTTTIPHINDNNADTEPMDRQHPLSNLFPPSSNTYGLSTAAAAATAATAATATATAATSTTTSTSLATATVSSHNPTATCAALRMADFLFTLDSILAVLFADSPHRRLIREHLERTMTRLAQQYRKQDQAETAKTGLRVCVLFVCRLVQQQILTIADASAFARHLPEFFTTHPFDVRFGWASTSIRSNSSNNTTTTTTTTTQTETTATSAAAAGTGDDEWVEYDIGVRDNMDRHRQGGGSATTATSVPYDGDSGDGGGGSGGGGGGGTFALGSNLVMHMQHPRWLVWFQETELRMMVLLDLVRAVVDQIYQSRPNDHIHLSYMTNMLQDTFTAFNTFKSR
ncbi:hypothetical protein BCR42DRAFT_416851 [Absidia repens]|uniref:F-box domain-containing protein n=1 Tax=Absidia repens TaxID=90262 RepID=A0A1X2IF83_9FUNG|nr:hypothetical protein BCR42DRAFT_416851 [Absidia repens]